MNYLAPEFYARGAPLRRAYSASATRKRSLQASSIPNDAARLSFTSRKSESDKDLLNGPLVPVGLLFMEQVALDISVMKEHADVRYVMTVHHLKTNTTWKHTRSFDEYRKFQHRLLKTLNHGHFCSAECPWLFTFLKSYFPKKNLFHFSTTRVIAARKAALQRFFVSLQTFLLNRANHNCSVVANGLVHEVVDFVYGSLATNGTLADNQLQNQRSSFLNGHHHSIDCGANTTTPEDDDTSTASGSTGSSSDVNTLCCQLCESSLEGAAYATSRSATSLDVFPLSAVDDDSMFEESIENQTWAVSSSSSAPATCSALSNTSTNVVGARRGTYYVTTLGCGHQFHDECIVPKLNETLRCPTCDHLEVK